MQGIWGDVRFGLRGWRKNPGFSVVATLTLALGIGLTTAIFSLVNAVLFRPLPIAGIERLVGVYNVGTSGFLSHEPLAYPDYVALRDGATSLSSLAGYATVPLALERGDENEMVFGEAVSGNYFSTIGVSPALGRGIEPEDDRPGATAVAVLNHATWETRFRVRPLRARPGPSAQRPRLYCRGRGSGGLQRHDPRAPRPRRGYRCRR